MKLRAILLVSSLFFFAAAQSAHAFSAGGHKVVALIAFQQMSPEAKARVVALLRSHPNFQSDFQEAMAEELRHPSNSEQEQWTFVQASIWPDIVRGAGGESFHRPKWHYINLPIFLSQADQQALRPHLQVNTREDWRPGMNESGLNAVQALDRIEKTFRSRHTSDSDRAVMICWIMHVVGDLHQPLHCAALFSQAQFPEGDRGGNSIDVRTGRIGSRVTNLHSLWDGLLGRDISFNDVRRRTFNITSNPELTQAAVQSQSQLQPSVWAGEGLAYANQYAYSPRIRQQIADAGGGQLQAVLLENGYESTAGAVASQRVAIAGYRLARMLEHLVSSR